MRVFIFEHMCGGGLVGRDLPGHLVQQGAAMLHAVTLDFLKLGVDVMTTLDSRVSLELGDAQLLRVGRHDHIDDVIDQLAAEADRALVIAPEWVGVLEHWTSKLTASGARRLGSAPEGITVCADKFQFAQRLEQMDVPVPRTLLFDHRRQLTGPVIVKLRHGAGCDNTFRHGSTDQLAAPPWRGQWIVQPYIVGQPVSVSVIVLRGKARPLLVGRQKIEGEGQLSYHGGEIPVSPDLASRAIALAERAVAVIPGLRGWVGVDLILAEDPAQDVVIEINPRVTMSYIGLRQLASTNLAAALLDPEAPITFRDGRVVYDADGHIQTLEFAEKTSATP